jgi:hypothetical protein
VAAGAGDRRDHRHRLVAASGRIDALT